MPELGLFPLPIVLLPTERIPLHIFEPRYRELIDECLATGGEFGLVFATDDGAVHEIGTRATVEDVLEEPDGGRLDVVVEGRERFRLLELTSGRSFTTALVERVIDDEDEPHQPLEVTRALEAFAALVAETESPVDVPERGLAARRLRARGARRLRARCEAGAARVDVAERAPRAADRTARDRARSGAPREDIARPRR